MEARLRQAEAHARAGRLAQARALLRSALARRPDDVPALVMLAEIDLREGASERAEFALRRAGDLGDPRAWYLLGRCLQARQDWSGARAALERSVAINPAEPNAWGELALTCAHSDDEAAAHRALASARSHAPDHPDGARWGVRVLLRLGDHAGALDACREIIARFPHDWMALQTAAYAMNSLEGVREDELLAAHKALGDAVSRGQPMTASFPNTRDVKRPLKVGLLSSDLRQHSCVFFLLSLVPALAARGLELCFYSTGGARDAFGDRLASHGLWRDITPGDEARLEAAIRGDRIDVLLDLSGWTAPWHMPVLVRRVAPVQVAYLGYPNTTGLPTMDARLVDSVTDPPEHARATERLVRLPAPFVRYTPAPDAPELSRDPQAPPTFGSFNAAGKITPGVMRLWARILVAAPGSRLLLKQHSLTPPNLRRYREILAREGVDPSRLEVAPFVPGMREHLAQYAGVDVALDPFPYNGTTTTCEALFMGVPVVTLAGEGHRSRVGASLLTACGHADWVATDEENYVGTAVNLIRQGLRDATARRALRALVERSGLHDADGLAAGIDECLRSLRDNRPP
jgi:protein O-GlcNAc transferase